MAAAWAYLVPSAKCICTSPRLREQSLYKIVAASVPGGGLNSEKFLEQRGPHSTLQNGQVPEEVQGCAGAGWATCLWGREKKLLTVARGDMLELRRFP